METLFFWLAKLVWLVIAPDSLLLLALLLSWVLLRRKVAGFGIRLLGGVCLFLLTLAFFPLGEWLLYPLESRFPPSPPLPQKVSGIIMLGGSESRSKSIAWGQVELNDAAERYFATMMLARRYPQAKVVFTGGSGNPLDQGRKEAEIARQFFAEQGFDLARFTFEKNSRNTYENGVLSKVLVKPHPGDKWLLVTSASHMPRAVGVFCQAGWPVLAYPVDHHALRGNVWRIEYNLNVHLGDLSLAVNEWVGLASYFATGKTISWLPQSGSC